jgi:hypothetical protein
MILISKPRSVVVVRSGILEFDQAVRGSRAPFRFAIEPTYQNFMSLRIMMRKSHDHRSKT